jgi:hypothetical protein
LSTPVVPLGRTISVRAIAALALSELLINVGGRARPLPPSLRRRQPAELLPAGLRSALRRAHGIRGGDRASRARIPAVAPLTLFDPATVADTSN